ncbi:MAG: hypothetical protein AAF483_11390 [Planctomycetota bacterium]
MKKRLLFNFVMPSFVLALALIFVGCNGETATRPTVYAGPPTDEEAATELDEKPDEQMDAPNT